MKFRQLHWIGLTLRLFIVHKKRRLIVPTWRAWAFIANHPYLDQTLGAVDGTYIRIMPTRMLVSDLKTIKVLWAPTGYFLWLKDVSVLCMHCSGWGWSWCNLSTLEPSTRLNSWKLLCDWWGWMCGLSEKVLSPFRGVKYHLKEWTRRSSGLPYQSLRNSSISDMSRFTTWLNR